MNDKKFTIKDEDMARLKSLLLEEEKRLDAANISDAELEMLERDVQQKLKRIAGAKSGRSTLSPDQEDRQRQWKAIERRVHPIEADEQKDLQTPSNVMPLHKKPSSKNWMTWAGAMAAAALALFVIIPALQKPQQVASDDELLMVSKGNSSSLPARCEISLLQTVKGGGTIVPSVDGMGYEGPTGTAFQLSVRCDRSGFLNVSIEGPQPLSLRNIPVTAGDAKGILHEGKLASFVLQYQSPWVISGLLSEREISSETALPRTESEAEIILGKSPVLWFDSIAVKGTNS